MQINRLFEIVYILLEKNTITAKQLAEHFNVSVRTIYRDIDILSTANIPIYTNKGKGGGISLLDNFVLDKSIISEEEQNQILFALQSLEKLNVNNKNALDKMSMLFNKSSKNWIEIDFSNWGQDNSQNDKFNKIKTAIINKQVIKIVYYNSYGQENIREIEPLQIYFKDKSWYIKSYCRLKKDYRMFKMSRIKDIQLLNEHFQRDLPTQIDKKYDIKVICLELKISKEMAYRVYDEFEKEDIKQDKNGDFIIKVEYPENDWVYGYLLSFGEYLEIESPKYAKEILKEKIEKMLQNYNF